MATTANRATRHLPGEADKTTAEEEPLVSETTSGAPTELSLLDDDYTQSILVALCEGPRRGRDLADRCEASRPTVYRRVNQLEDAGLIRTEMRVDPDGHHCKEFHLVRDRLTVAVEDGTITVTVQPTPADAPPAA